MKAIGVVGSPRKNGNTNAVVQAVLDGAKEAGFQTEKFNLNEMSYRGCQACDYCKTADHDHCRQEDDVSKLLKEIAEADAVVFGSPIYFFQFTGQFRLMEDRMYSLIDKSFTPRIKPGKKAIIVTSQGNPNPDAFNGAINEFKQALGLLGFNLVDTIKVVGANSLNTAKEDKDLMERARADGKAL